jgi:3-hydroxyisobutyrate dehydrogenase-like beta-hydroxyacid dehydrogenase
MESISFDTRKESGLIPKSCRLSVAVAEALLAASGTGLSLTQARASVTHVPKAKQLVDPTLSRMLKGLYA